MISRVRLASVAVLLLLVSASISSAQQPDSASSAPNGARQGRGAVGLQFGGSWLLAEKDYSDGAQPRFSVLGSYRYVISPHWQWQVSPYFTWAAYKTGRELPFQDANFPSDTTKDFVLTQLAGGNGQVQWVGGRGGYRWHLGAGPAIYRVVVQNHRKVLKDPVSRRLHAGTYLGATFEWGAERFMKSLPNTSLEWTLAWQTAFAQRNDQFPSGFNGKPAAFEFRFGAHYYFDIRKKKPDAGPGSRR